MICTFLDIHVLVHARSESEKNREELPRGEFMKSCQVTEILVQFLFRYCWQCPALFMHPLNSDSSQQKNRFLDVSIKVSAEKSSVGRIARSRRWSCKAVSSIELFLYFKTCSFRESSQLDMWTSSNLICTRYDRFTNHQPWFLRANSHTY